MTFSARLTAAGGRRTLRGVLDFDFDQTGMPYRMRCTWCDSSTPFDVTLPVTNQAASWLTDHDCLFPERLWGDDAVVRADLEPPHPTDD